MSVVWGEGRAAAANRGGQSMRQARRGLEIGAKRPDALPRWKLEALAAEAEEAEAAKATKAEEAKVAEEAKAAAAKAASAAKAAAAFASSAAAVVPESWDD